MRFSNKNQLVRDTNQKQGKEVVNPTEPITTHHTRIQRGLTECVKLDATSVTTALATKADNV